MDTTILQSLRNALLERVSLDALPPDVWKQTAALNTWGTNAIEGSTITREEADSILLEGKSVPGRPMRDVLETVQHERTFRTLAARRASELTMLTVRGLHFEIFLGILPDAGEWRRVNVRIRGARHSPPRMEKVPMLMESWREEYIGRDVEGEEVFALAAWMHHGFEHIHPFSDGNGRVGRLLLNLHFMRRNWPPVHVLPAHRDEYLYALETAGEGDTGPLEGLLRMLTGASLVDLLDQVGTGRDELRPLRELARSTPYGEKYLALRCSQGELPAVKVGRGWRSSRRAVELYRRHVGREKAKQIRLPR